MEEIKKINVTVTYKVGLGGIEAPLEVMKQLKKAFDYNVEINTDEFQNNYEDAYEWLVEKIKEKDCFSWSCEINSLKL